MKKIYYLSSCSTCKRILKELDPPSSFILKDIKADSLTEKEIEEMREMTDSYEELFNGRAQKLREKDLKKADMEEDQFKNLLLEHYSFLKRPVIINNDEIFIGNSQTTVEAAKKSIKNG